MFKNSKILKGIVLSLALVLVVGAGVLLKMQASAEANTVVFYVSDNGNNTTGKDAATAFTSISAATKAANDMKLAPGTEVKLIVVDQIFATSRNMDGATAKDSAGGKLHFTITSEDAGSKATILHLAYNSSGSTSYEKIILSNNITFKDIIISAQVQPYYQGNAPITDPIDYGKLYRTRYIHAGSNDVVFDNCEITSTYPSESKAVTWTLLCDAYESSSVEGKSSLTLLNGDYSNCTVYVQDQVTPLWDLSLYVENATVGTVYALADTDTGTSVNAKSVTCTFKDATVSSYNPMGRGNVAVTEGVTAIFEGDTVVKNWVACMSNSSSTGTYHGDLRYYFRDNCSISVTSTDSNSEAIIYLTPPVMNGDLYVNVEGGTFNQALCTGTDKNKSLSTAPYLNGNIYNEFKGGTFKAGLYCGMGRAGGTIYGSIYNNFYDGYNLEKGTSYYGGRLGVTKGDVVNNIYGGTVAKVEIYMGGGYSESAKTCILEGDLITNVYGGTFGGTFWGGPRGQTVKGGIYNTFMGGTFATTFVASGLQVICPEVHNVFKNGPDGQHATLNGGSTYLGPRGGTVVGTYNIGKLYNTFEGDVYVKGNLYCADGTQTNVNIEELVYNEFKSGTFGDGSSRNVYCTTAAKNNVLGAEVVNNFYDGATFVGRVYGGGQSGGSGSITNNFYGGLFKSYVYGASSETADKDYDYKINGNLTNNFYGGTFNSQLICGGKATCDSLLTNNFYGGIFKYFIYGNSNGGNYNQMDVVNNIYGGEFQAWFCGGSNKSQGGTITNNVYGGHFIGSHKEALNSEAGRMCFLGGDYSATGTGEKVPLLQNNIYGGVFEQRVYLGGRIATINKIHSLIAGGTFNGDRLSPSMYQDSASKNCSEVKLDIKPDESDCPLFFGCRYTDYGVEGAKVYWSYGLENLKKRPKDTVVLYGAAKPIYIAGNSFLNFDEILGEVTFIQTEDWVDGNVYVTVPAQKDLSMISFANAEAGLSGSAEIVSKAVGLDNENDVREGTTNVSCTALVGTDNASAPTVAATPGLAAINFVLDNNLQVNFYVEKSALEAYLTNAGNFTYRITCGDDVLASGTVASLSDVEIVSGYAKIKSEFSVAAFGYGQTITLDFAGTCTDYTVYQLLQVGIDNSVDSPELVALLKAIYNYGVEAEKLYAGEASVSDYYSEITYTGTYNGKASAASYAAGYAFAGTGLSIGKEVSLNFYLKAASIEDLSFVATSATGVLDSSRVVVTPFDGNSAYNVVISLRLDVASMDEVFTLTVKNTAGTELAACSNSVAYPCANYIAANNDFAPVSAALLAYVEKAQAL